MIKSILKRLNRMRDNQKKNNKMNKYLEKVNNNISTKIIRIRYDGDWAAIYPTEFLLPQLRKDIQLAEFPFIQQNLENPEWSEKELREEINKLGHWEYFFLFPMVLQHESILHLMITQ